MKCMDRLKEARKTQGELMNEFLRIGEAARVPTTFIAGGKGRPHFYMIAERKEDGDIVSVRMESDVNGVEKTIDMTWTEPESLDVAKAILGMHGHDLDEILAKAAAYDKALDRAAEAENLVEHLKREIDAANEKIQSLQSALKLKIEGRVPKSPTARKIVNEWDAKTGTVKRSHKKKS